MGRRRGRGSGKPRRGGGGRRHGKLAAFFIIAVVAVSIFNVAGSTSNEDEYSDISEEGIDIEGSADADASSGSDDPTTIDEDEAGESDGSPTVSSGDAEGELRVRYLDVGQGDCTLVSCDGEYLLIDGGDSDHSSEVYSVLERLDVDCIDYIVATHPDADHIGGISGALNEADCGTFYCSVTSHDTETFEDMVSYLGDTEITVPSAGDTFYLGEALVTFVGPVSNYDDTNNGSLVLRIDYGDTSFLFTGDAETESEDDMIAAGADLSADVLKVGHHGSRSSSSSEFLQEVDPEYAIISVGADNEYGHPTEEVLERLDSIGAEVYRTDEDGSVVVVSDGETITVETTTGLVSE